MTQDQTNLAEIQPSSISSIKKLFPGEWVLIGDPVMDDDALNILAGIPILHSKDKKEVCYLGREKVAKYQTFSLIYTGNSKPVRKIVSLYSRQKK